MLDNLLNLVREQADEAIVNNPAIDNSRNEEAIGTASESITNTLQDAISNGGIQNVMALFSNGGAGIEGNPLVQNIVGSLSSTLESKFNIDASQSASIANSLIPTVMGKLVNKTNDPNDSSFDLESIMSSLGGAGGIASALGGLFGK